LAFESGVGPYTAHRDAAVAAAGQDEVDAFDIGEFDVDLADTVAGCQWSGTV
jgi:hypothetical protein